MPRMTKVRRGIEINECTYSQPGCSTENEEEPTETSLNTVLTPDQVFFLGDETGLLENHEENCPAEKYRFWI